MALVALGINHKTAPLHFREQMAFSPDQMASALCSCVQHTPASGVVILSTCNRTELYAEVDTDYAAEVSQWFSRFQQADDELVAKHSYCFYQQQALEHLIVVASGLDSMVLGEPQILGQLKQAYNQAKHQGTVDKALDTRFQFAFSVAKKVRTQTDIGRSAVSVAFCSVKLAQQIFDDLSRSEVMLLGAGETIELVAEHLTQQKLSGLIVANRTIARAQEMIGRLSPKLEHASAKAITIEQIPEYLARCDLLISSTASSLPIIGKGLMESVMRQRKQKPMLLIDLAVPRDIEPAVDELDTAFVYDVDGLQAILEQNKESRLQSVEQAQSIIREQLMAFEQWQLKRDQGKLIQKLRAQLNENLTPLFDKAARQIEQGDNAAAVFQELQQRTINQTAHVPTQMVKQLGEQESHLSLADFCRLYQLEYESVDAHVSDEHKTP